MSIEKNDYHEKVNVDNVRNNNYTEYESNDDRMKTLSVKEYSLTDSVSILSRYFHIQCNYYSEHYLHLLFHDNHSSLCSKMFPNISNYSICSYFFFSLKRFLMSLSVVSPISFFI